MADRQQRPDDDDRFTFGLTLDVAKVLAARGYPIVADAGKDLVDLHQALFRFLYDDTDLGLRPVAPRPRP